MNHGKKMVAPIIITVVVALYYLAIGILFLSVPEIAVWGKALMVIIPLVLAGVMIGVLCSRIKEIRSGEEDDLSKY